MCIKSECGDACVYFFGLGICVSLLFYVFSFPTHTHTHTTKSRPIQWILTAKKNRPMKYAWKSSPPKHTEMFCLPLSQCVKH